jgi:RNA polymerase sigma-70 factor (ECF subfamily)
MTQSEYGTAYQDGCNRTVRFLLSRGLSEDAARETAQAAWVRGWERRAQIRDEQKTLTWVNSIALNLYRSQLRREQKREPMREISAPPRVSLDAIDACLMLDRCRRSDRDLMAGRYLFGYEIHELARDQGCTETAVRVRLMRARRHMRRLFEGNQRFHGSRAAAAASPAERRSPNGDHWFCRQAA